MVVLIVVTLIFADKLRDKGNTKGGRIYESFISYLLLSCELEGDINLLKNLPSQTHIIVL